MSAISPIEAEPINLKNVNIKVHSINSQLNKGKRKFSAFNLYSGGEFILNKRELTHLLDLYKTAGWKVSLTLGQPGSFTEENEDMYYFYE